MSTTMRLIWQDPARGGFVRAVLTGLGVGLLFRMAPGLGDDIASLAVTDLPPGFVPFYLLLTVLAATFVLSSNAWTRSSRFALALPLSTRRVWAVRTACLIGVALASVAAFAVTMGVSLDLGSRHIAMNPVVMLAAARSAATVVLMLFMFQLPNGERDRISISAPYVMYVVFVGTIILFSSAGRILSIEGSAFFLAIGLGLGIWLWYRVPANFSVGPTVAESSTPAWTAPATPATVETEGARGAGCADADGGLFRGVHWVVIRGLRANMLTWVFLLVFGASMGVVTAEFFNGTNAIFPFLMLAIYVLPYLQASIEAMPPYDHLPISRRVLWAHTIVPIILSCAIGAGVSLLVFLLNPHPFTQIQYSQCCFSVPWDYLEISREGRAPTVISVWGESHQPGAQPLWPGYPVAIFDPFEVGPKSSPRFVELQMRRAVEAVYGIPVPESLTVSGSEASEVNTAVAVIDEIRGHSSGDRNRSAAVALALLTVAATGFILVALLQYGYTVYRKVFKWILRGSLALIGVIALAVVVARVLGLTEIWYVGALASIGIRSLAHWLPLPTWLLWMVCVSLWVGSYFVLEKAFSSIELPREKTMNRFAEEY